MTDRRAAVAAYVRTFVLRRIKEIEEKNGTVHGARAQVARELDMTAANVTHWVAGKPGQASEELEQKVADLLHGGSVDELRAAAIRSAEVTQDEFPDLFVRALGRLAVRSPGRDFTSAARALLATDKPQGLDEHGLADLIAGLHADSRNKSVGVRGAPLKDEPTGRGALSRGKKR